MTRPGTEKRQKTVSLKFRVTPEEAREIENKAAAANTTISNFVRAACLKRQIMARTDRETVRELSKIGGLLKKAIKQTPDRDRQKEISRVLDTLQPTVQEILNRQGAQTVADRLAPDDTEPEGRAECEPGAVRKPDRVHDRGANGSQTIPRTVTQTRIEDHLDLVGEG